MSKTNIKEVGILDPTGKNLNPITNKEYSKKYLELAKSWSKLPAYENAIDIINKITKHQVILITSGTGSGKTVLVPNYALHSYDYKGRIAVTLPKQLTTKNAAEYEADILDVNLGIDIGYQYKGSEEEGRAENPKILYATDGTIVSRLMNDPELKDLDCVIIDEAHERKVQIDFLLYLLKNVVKTRKDFKLIIMSATINSEIFESYFAEYNFININISGKTNYPIESIFSKTPVGKNEYITKGLEIIDMLKTKINKKNKASDILFFVCSINETIDVCNRLRSKYNDIVCIEVYSGISPEKQEMLKNKTTEELRIIVSTNVAESSLTIDGIKYVIDSGFEFLSYYNPDKRAKVLEKKLISQAQAKQRMGRAGRTQAGICYHLYTENDFINIMNKYPEPSIRLSDITTESLRLLAIKTIKSTQNLLKIYSEFIEPPREKYIRLAISKMMSLGVIENNEINKLGDFVSSLQSDIEFGLSMYCAYHLDCLKEIVVIASIIELIRGNIGDIFKFPLDRNADRRLPENIIILEKYNKSKNKFKSKYGDHVTLLSIYEFIENKKEDELQKKTEDLFMKYSTISKIKDNVDRLYIRVKELFRDREKINIENIQSYDIDYRVLTALLFGFKLNIAYNKDNMYKTDYADRINISRDSFLKGEMPKTVFYNELFINNNDYNINIVSTIPLKSKELYEKFIG